MCIRDRYYASRSARVAEYRKLDQDRSLILNRLLAEEVDRVDAKQADRDALKEIEIQMAKVSRPTGFFRAGEITRRGSDFVGIRELQSSTEFLVPLERILHVISVPSE